MFCFVSTGDRTTRTQADTHRGALRLEDGCVDDDKEHGCTQEQHPQSALFAPCPMSTPDRGVREQTEQSSPSARAPTTGSTTDLSQYRASPNKCVGRLPFSPTGGAFSAACLCPANDCEWLSECRLQPCLHQFPTCSLARLLSLCAWSLQASSGMTLDASASPPPQPLLAMPRTTNEKNGVFRGELLSGEDHTDERRIQR
eukprot:3941930-Rhodomonas_salina.1